ncbi:hypothetical protein HYH03_011929 [Edaphochlamys debaryana]|uniref:Uncharacterized protein n=1 Tax=Edaphochlamys debaryana TaxID=47281 RepID=A0A835XZA8_9CHLO|nr:hypothetical protein HYH03_011929 [Edaphochlamys debaryana]|eukprot:KAG2489650.1 hypothetical protein HYH03_011929 [Edaphochlamys debaryana]
MKAQGRVLDGQVLAIVKILHEAERHAELFSMTNFWNYLALDKAQRKFEELSKELKERTKQLMLGVNVETFRMVQELLQAKFEVAEADEQLKALVEAGLAKHDYSMLSLLNDEEAFNNIIKQLQGGESIIVRYLKELPAKLNEPNTADKERTAHVISQPQLKAFWKAHACGLEMPWSAFWKLFPMSLALDLSKVDRENLQDSLKDPEDKLAFEEAVDNKANPETISVAELAACFGESDDLVKRVTELVGEGRRARALRWLPLSPHFHGRADEIEKLQTLLTNGSRVVVVHGYMGYGKAQLLYRTAQKLAEAGELEGGGYRVDLQSGRIEGKDGLLARLVSAFGPAFRFAGGADLQTLRARLGVIGTGRHLSGLGADMKQQSPAPRCLLLLDHADYVLASDKLRSYLEELLNNHMLPLARNLVVAISARKHPQLKEIAKAGYDVKVLWLEKPLADYEVAAVLSSMCPRLEALPNTGLVMVKTNGVPLFVSLAATALNSVVTQKPRSKATSFPGDSPCVESGSVDPETERLQLLEKESRQLEEDRLELEKEVLAKFDSTNVVDQVLSCLPRTAGRDLMFLSLFPGPFTLESAHKLLSRPAALTRASGRALEGLVDSGQLQAYSDERTGVDVFEMQWAVRSALSSAWAATEARLEQLELKLTGDELVDVARRFVLAQAAALSKRATQYRSNAVKVYKLAGLEKHAVEQALRLPVTEGFKDLVDGPEGMDPAAGGSLVGVLAEMLLELHTVDVHAPSSIRTLVFDLRPVFARCGHTPGLTACAVVGAVATEHTASSWRAAMKKVSAAIEPYLSTSDPVLLRACVKGLRLLGVTARDREYLEESMKHLQRAVDILTVAGEDVRRSAWFGMEEALCTAELAGSLDYLGTPRLLEAAEAAAQALKLAKAATAGGDGMHPLVALTLTTRGYILKNLRMHVEALKVHHDAEEIRAHVFGRGHADVATSLNQAAISLIELGDLAKADINLQEALRIRSMALGEDNFMVANTQLHIAALRDKQDRPEDVKTAYHEAARIYNKNGLKLKEADTRVKLAMVLEKAKDGKGAGDAAAQRRKADELRAAAQTEKEVAAQL